MNAVALCRFSQAYVKNCISWRCNQTVAGRTARHKKGFVPSLQKSSLFFQALHLGYGEYNRFNFINSKVTL